MSELNAYLHRYHRGQMATACYLLYRRSTRTSTYVKAGHPPPLVVAGDGTSRYLDGPISPPVGPVPGARYLQLSQAAGHALADRMSQPTGTHPWAGRTLTAVWGAQRTLGVHLVSTRRRPGGRRRRRPRRLGAVAAPRPATPHRTDIDVAQVPPFGADWIRCAGGLGVAGSAGSGRHRGGVRGHCHVG
ncbi:SpoIIE family protein phosphatase [Streptomyces sp. WI03-4A]|uniref:SpoIIE family protein phosphatase n=1 Tax=Streptomyces sp. WI03-4A TaxID=3028706 RepID=UPI0039F4A209